MELEKLEERVSRLESIMENPPQFKVGDHVLNIAPCRSINHGYVESWHYGGRQWLYSVIDENRKHIDTWGENNTVLFDEVKKVIETEKL